MNPTRDAHIVSLFSPEAFRSQMQRCDPTQTPQSTKQTSLLRPAHQMRLNARRSAAKTEIAGQSLLCLEETASFPRFPVAERAQTPTRVSSSSNWKVRRRRRQRREKGLGLTSAASMIVRMFALMPRYSTPPQHSHRKYLSPLQNQTRCIHVCGSMNSSESENDLLKRFEDAARSFCVAKTGDEEVRMKVNQL